MAFFETLLTGHEISFIIGLAIAVIAGTLIGIEREARWKPAGISTQSLVIGGAFIFTFMSTVLDPNSPARVAAQVVSGVGFLGAGIILKGGKGKITNLTTAASIWYAAAIGMTIGFGWYLIAVAAVVYAIFVPRIPHISKKKP